MAKISSYPSDANVTTSDRLIGSDNENSNETKNFSVGDIINLAASIIVPAGGFVPYTGATTNVDLGAFGLTTSYLTSSLGMFIDGAISLNGDEGNTGEVLVSQGPGATPSWSNALSQFVPYTGATGNVDLGTYNLIADNVQANIFQLNSGGILGLYGTLQLNGNPGASGQVLTSSGGGVPTWTSLSGFVPYTGATGAVNLGVYSLTANNVHANNFLPIVGGSGNVFFGGAGGGGVAHNGMACIGTNITVLGDSTAGLTTDIEVDAGTHIISFNYGSVSLSNIYSLSLSNGNGTAGESVLVSGGGGAPSWKYPQDIVAFPFLSAYSDLTQTIVAANLGQPIVLNQTVQSSAISINANGSGDLTRITFNDSGMYNIQFSAQLRRTVGGSSQTVDIWFRKGGSDIPNSNTSVNVQANAGYLVASWNFFYYIDVTQPNPFIEIMWAGTDNSVTLAAAVSSAVHPATPSVIVTVNKVSNVI